MENILTIISKSDAALVLGALTIISTTFVVAWMKSLTWPDWAKFLILATISLIGGFLSAYSTGSLDQVATMSIVPLVATIYMSARGFYYLAFQFLGLDRVLWPKGAVMNAAKANVAEQLSNITNTEAQDVLDPSKTVSVSVKTTVE